ncbi:restriction endonuclease subunit S [Macrococcus brunensis]|uniref:Restriction endonuclease subunit S n=1 Tax=Macrococcus brunensis TaxID=198483 RepID=A0A4R6BB76_9STAP|nr:restriction endonuclease subunit S [Macrococcus brunensis]TDL94173.1 restriction endonuclease subunit S [Macrococcus brunensis]
MTNEKRVPKLRFPEFSGEWEEKILGDSMTLLKSGLSRELSSEDIGYPVIRANNIQNYRLKLQDIKYWYVKDPQGANTENYLLEKNDILVNFINSEAKMGTSCIIKKELPRKMIYTTNILRYQVNEFNDSYFHYSYTQTLNYKKWIRIITKPAVNQASFTTVDFKKIPYFVPTLKEQQKIGEFFSKLDRQIELEEKKLALLEEQKKGYMQKIFSQELRFKDEHGEDYPEWEKFRVDEICNLSIGFTPSTKDELLWTGSIPWISIAGMNSKYIKQANKTISKEAIRKKEAVKAGTLIMSFKLTIGNVAILKKDMYTNEAICHFNWIHNNINNEYVYYYLKTIDVKSYGSRAAKGITLNNESLNSILLKLPQREEQDKISNFLKTIDDKVTLVNDKIKLRKALKDYFLQNMLL